MLFDFRKNKKYDYIAEFEKLGHYSTLAAEFLHAVLKEYEPADMSLKLAKMHEIEHAADVEKKEMYGMLIDEFLAPIEKDDIIRLSHEIDTVTDSIEDVLISINIFGIENIHSEMTAFSELLVDCCGHMNRALAELQNYQNSNTLFDHIDSVRRHKSRGKELYIKSLRNIFEIASGPVDIMAYTEIYTRFVECFENCKKVTNTVERIVIKNL
ncbi:DUF47 domain-containing protein [Anaerobium acetethylicum]|uniref:Phosphate transport regulator (Distant homolog of PhoU) n=1 Tax=Anaerobium acetethylicum TaxID=1619234 RepID=A0A1D3TNB2_9FIRM|nr:DUF47 family protein [Anaerobium acetethylicum]SCP94812.1 hypothetical protein SAMN05421730_100169 [Anaerobium acetethylicum]